MPMLRWELQAMTQTSRRILAVLSGLLIAALTGGDKQSWTLAIMWTVSMYVILFVSHL